MKIDTNDVYNLSNGLSFYASTIADGYVLMSGNTSDVMYLYINTTDNMPKLDTTQILLKHFASDEVARLSTVSMKDEMKLLDGISEEVYSKLLRDLNLTSYLLYRIDLRSQSKKYKTAPKFKEESNMDDNTFYIVLRNDLNLSVGMQATYVSEITTAMLDDLRIDHKLDEFNNFLDLSKNTVVLQASGKDLFEINFIPAEYADPKINFTYVYEDTERVAHHNFRLKEGKIVAMGFFGIKKHLPKFLRKLSLYGE